MRPRVMLAALLLLSGQAACSAGALPPRQTVPGEQVAELARSYLLGHLQGQDGVAAVAVSSVPSDVTLPPGHPVLRVRPVDAQVLRSRMVVWVDVGDGKRYSRPVPVPLAVEIRRPVLVAARSLPAGGFVGGADLTVEVRDVVALAGPAAPLLAAGVDVRLRRNVLAGAALTLADVGSIAVVLRGDRVRLLAGADGMLIENAAMALSDGEPGQYVMVLPAQASAAVRARVAGAGVVRLDD